jgi:hypothetical protein
MAMIAMTTSSSMSVKPRARRRGVDFMSALIIFSRPKSTLCAQMRVAQISKSFENISGQDEVAF